MATAYAIEHDIRNKCGKVEGNRPGLYVLDNAWLYYGGKDHGLQPYVQKIYIFEDIDKHGITGWIDMIDIDNVISGQMKEHTITGQELLTLKFSTNGSKFSVDFTKHPLHVHKIENLRLLDQGTGVKSASTVLYRIHFCSPELMNNERIRVSKAYEATYSDIVKDILQNILKTGKDIWLEETKDIHKVVIPNMHPFDAIRWIIKKCRSNSFKVKNQPNYNFYETTKGYRFKTLHVQSEKNTGSADTPDANDYQMGWTVRSGATHGNYVQEMHTAKDFKFVRTGDTYAAIRNGMLASKSILHDSYHKMYTVRATSYMPSWDKREAGIESLPDRGFVPDYHITDGTVHVPTGDKFPGQMPAYTTSESFTEFPDSRIFFDSTGSKHAYDFADDKGVRTVDTATDQMVTPLWHMQQRHDRYLQVQLTVHGISGLQVGDAISIQFPWMGVKKSKAGLPDMRWTQAYYITKLVHRVNLQEDIAEYSCDIVCSATGGALQKLPKNAKLAGELTATGSIKDFSGRTER